LVGRLWTPGSATARGPELTGILLRPDPELTGIQGDSNAEFISTRILVIGSENRRQLVDAVSGQVRGIVARAVPLPGGGFVTESTRPTRLAAGRTFPDDDSTPAVQVLGTLTNPAYDITPRSADGQPVGAPFRISEESQIVAWSPDGAMPGT
jgi:hypothetical protein